MFFLRVFFLGLHFGVLSFSDAHEGRQIEATRLTYSHTGCSFSNLIICVPGVDTETCEDVVEEAQTETEVNEVSKKARKERDANEVTDKAKKGLQTT